MALARLKAHRAAREEAERVEKEEREQMRLETERKEEMMKEKDDLKREFEKIMEEDRNWTGDGPFIKEEEKVTNACITAKRLETVELTPSASTSSDSGLAIEEDANGYMNIDALDLADDEDELPRFGMDSKKRALDDESKEENESKRQRNSSWKKYDDLFDGVDEKDVLDYLASVPVVDRSRRSLDVDSGIDCSSVKLEGTPELDNNFPPPNSIKVHVGPEIFFLQKDDLTHHSEYFNEILSYGFNPPDEEQTIILPDVDADTFDLFTNFVRFGKVLSHQETDIELGPSPSRSCHIDHEWPRLAEAWLVGEKLRSTSFKDAVVDTMLLKIHEHDAVPVCMYQDLYSSEIPRNCGIQRLLVDLAVKVWDERVFELDEVREDVEAGHEFFQDIEVAREEWEEGLGDERLWERFGCEYHDHDEERKECYRLSVPDLWVTSGRLPAREQRLRDEMLREETLRQERAAEADGESIDGLSCKVEDDD